MSQEGTYVGATRAMSRESKDSKILRLVTYTDRQSLRELLVYDERPVMFTVNTELCFYKLEKMSCQQSFAQFAYLMNSKQVLSVGTPGNIPSEHGNQFQFMAGSHFVFVKPVKG